MNNRYDYIAPDIRISVCQEENLMSTSLNKPDGNPKDVTPAGEEYGGEFRTRRCDVWDDGEE